MRKALVGLILAATVMTPVAAEAQRGRRGDGPRVQQQNESDNGEARAARAEQRQEQREARQAQQQAQPQAQVQQPQPPVQVVQRDRGGNRGGGDGNRNWRGGNNNDNNDNRGDGRQGRERASQPSVYPQAWQGNPNDPRLRHYQDLERRNQQQGARDGRRGDDRRDWRNDNRRDARNDRGDRRNWNRGWRNDRRYDWQRWRYSNRNIFHIGPYYSPYRGYGYNRFSIGLFLEPLFFGRNYWIGDPWQYRLPPAYPGTQWVRYYNDVLLVDTYSGEVLDVIYNFFY